MRLVHSRETREAPGYAELVCRSAFSFLEGASRPEELVDQALELGLSGLALTDREFAVSLGISERTLGRVRTTEGSLTPVAGDRLYRLARIYALSKEVLEDGPRAMDWLRRPQVGLGGRIPLDMISTEAGAREVENLLGRIEHGVLS